MTALWFAMTLVLILVAYWFGKQVGYVKGLDEGILEGSSMLPTEERKQP